MQNNQKLVLTLLLFVLFGVVITQLYYTYGVGWDFVAHFLSSKAILSKNFTNFLTNIISNNQTSIKFGILESKELYFEIYRAPLSIILFSIIDLVSVNYALIIYLLLMVIFLFVSIFYISKSMKIEFMVISSLLILPYLFSFPFFVNSEEILSLIFMLFALGLQIKGKWYSGIFLGLAGLSKYTALIFLPMLLFQTDKKKILYSYVGFGLVTLPWLIFNYAFFGNFFYSYFSSISVSLESSPISMPSVISLLIIIINFIPGIIILTIAKRKNLLNYNLREKIKKPIYKIRNFYLKERAYFITIIFSILSLILFVILGFHESVFDQTRYAYFLYTSIALLIAINITTLKEKGNTRKKYKLSVYTLYAFSLICMVGTIILISINISNLIGVSNLSFFRIFNQNQNILQSYNLQNCSIISNDWVYLRYYNISAFSPYGYIKNSSKYPKLIFNYFGTSPNAISTYNDSVLFKNENFTLFVNKSSYSC